jgi:hypothetical protein
MPYRWRFIGVADLSDGGDGDRFSGVAEGGHDALFLGVNRTGLLTSPVS